MKLGPSLGLGHGSGGAYSPDWAWLKEKTNAELLLLSSYLQANLAARGGYRTDRAQSIRDNAGVPAAEVAGIPGGVPVGASGSLTVERNQTFSNEAALASFAASGSGSVLDPYIIEDLDFNAATGGTSTALHFNDPDGAYYVKVRNCKFGNYTGNYILANLITPIELENVTFDSATTVSNGIRIDQGGAIITGLYVPGLGINNVVFVNSSTALDIKIRYLKFDSSVRDWTGAGRLIFFNNMSQNINIDVQYADIDFTGTTVQPQGLLFGGDADVRSIIFNNVKWRGGKSALNQIAAGGVPLGLWENIEVFYCDVAETTEEAIHLMRADNIEVGYGTFAHVSAGAGSRLVYFNFDSANSGHACSNIHAHHLKLTKTSGTFTAGNEALETRAASGNVRFNDCWATDASEDAFEFVSLRPNSIFIAYNLVGDGVRGQIMDVARTWDEGSWSETAVNPTVDTPFYVSHIYGDCQDRVLTCSGVRGGIVHDIYGDNSVAVQASVEVQDWTAPAYQGSRVFVAGPLPLAAEQGSAGAALITATGSDIEIRYVDESGTLQIVT